MSFLEVKLPAGFKKNGPKKRLCFQNTTKRWFGNETPNLQPVVFRCFLVTKAKTSIIHLSRSRKKWVGVSCWSKTHIQSYPFLGFTKQRPCKADFFLFLLWLIENKISQEKQKTANNKQEVVICIALRADLVSSFC